MLVKEYVVLAKQAIYDLKKKCYGHELLFRTPIGASAVDFGGEIATRQVLVNFCASISSASDEHQLPVFVSVDSEVVLEFDSLPVTPSRVVIELSERVQPCEKLVASIKAWKARGFVFSLECHDFNAKWEPLIELVDYIKVDVLALSSEGLSDIIPEIEKYQCKWVAKRVESEEIFEHCKALGFDLVQGYFLARPKEVMGQSIRPGTAVTIKLLKELERADITMSQIATLVSEDPKLTMKMLKIINSSLFSLPKPVEDLQEALTFLGVDMLKQWAMMIAFLSNGNVHIEACRLVLLRAKTCELICLDNPKLAGFASSAFLVGLVSGTDILLKISAKDFVAQVSLSESLCNAILRGEGDLGHILALVYKLEYTVCQNPIEVQAMPLATLQSYKEASLWTDKVVRTLKGH